MKTKRIKDFSYNGFCVQTSLLDNPIDVEIIGVQSPPDPGMVFVREGDKEYNVPTCALECCPNIDWDALMPQEQKTLRESTGLLIGNGGFDTTLVPIDSCPIMEAA